MIDWKNHIHSDSKILLVTTTTKGTRISVELYSTGCTSAQILGSYSPIRQSS